MKALQRGRRRGAISPILATILLIAVTVIAALSVAGLVFGLLGSFTSTATVTAQAATCMTSTGVCDVTLINTGASSVTMTGCSVQVAGKADASTTFGHDNPVTTIGASSSLDAVCRAGAPYTGQTVGSLAVGSFSMNNGASVLFSGTWS
ncbi:MAG: type IV pilin [Nitrososphaerales archaeon]